MLADVLGFTGWPLAKWYRLAEVVLHPTGPDRMSLVGSTSACTLSPSSILSANKFFQCVFFIQEELLLSSVIVIADKSLVRTGSQHAPSFLVLFPLLELSNDGCQLDFLFFFDSSANPLYVIYLRRPAKKS